MLDVHHMSNFWYQKW